MCDGYFNIKSQNLDHIDMHLEKQLYNMVYCVALKYIFKCGQFCPVYNAINSYHFLFSCSFVLLSNRYTFIFDIGNMNT